MTKRLVLVWLLLLGVAWGQAREFYLSDRPHTRHSQSLSGQSLFPPPFDRLVPSIGRLGQTIDGGREQRDVNRLLQAVVILHQAESLVGRDSGLISSHDLLEEATQMAIDQRNLEALRQAERLWNDPVRAPSDPTEASKTHQELEELQQEQAFMQQKRRCRIVFHNQTDGPLDIHLNQKTVGTLAARSSREIGDILAGRQHLMASDERLAWGPRRVFVGPGEIFHWRLYD